MPLTTKVARSYTVRMIVIGVLCVLFGLWGIYDLWVKIPRQEAMVDRYEQLDTTIGDYEKRVAAGQNLLPEQVGEYQAARDEMERLNPGGAVPERPSKFDRLTQWFFILCLPCAPYFFWLLMSAHRRAYRLEDDGTLVTPAGSWPASKIGKIDMSRWMARSIAHVVHEDGQRIKLDDYIYRGTHRIVGAIASRFEPDQWTAEAKLIRPDGEEQPEGQDQDQEPGLDDEPTA
jgi:hypothetical protein